MKKLTYLLMSAFLVGTMFSCTNETTVIPKTEESEVLLKSSNEKIESAPESENEVTPYIIPGDNPGGNRTCDEVEAAWSLEDDFLCGGKIDYNEDDGTWEGEFPEELNVTVNNEDKTLSFSTNDDGCVNIDGKDYKVGAVIVKGGPEANVYFYENGTLTDAGLGAPEEKMISNLTFCFVECEKELAIAVKSLYGYDNDDESFPYYAVSEGSKYFSTGDRVWCDSLGINFYPETSEFDLRRWNGKYMGNVTIEESDVEGIHSLIITVDIKDGWIIDHTYLYVGSLSGITESPLASDGCPEYGSWPYQDDSNENTHVFTIPFEELN